MVSKAFVADAADLIWLTFSPQAGHEQAGRRPALVLSPSTYNRRSGLALLCSVTKQAKGYPFEVAIPAGQNTTGVILADHLRSADWRARRAERLGTCPPDVVDEVRARLAPLLGF